MRAGCGALPVAGCWSHLRDGMNASECKCALLSLGHREPDSTGRRSPSGTVTRAMARLRLSARYPSAITTCASVKRNVVASTVTQHKHSTSARLCLLSLGVPVLVGFERHPPSATTPPALSVILQQCVAGRDAMSHSSSPIYRHINMSNIVVKILIQQLSNAASLASGRTNLTKMCTIFPKRWTTSAPTGYARTTRRHATAECGGVITVKHYNVIRAP